MLKSGRNLNFESELKKSQCEKRVEEICNIKGGVLRKNRNVEEEWEKP